MRGNLGYVAKPSYLAVPAEMLPSLALARLMTLLEMASQPPSEFKFTSNHTTSNTDSSNQAQPTIPIESPNPLEVFQTQQPPFPSPIPFVYFAPLTCMNPIIPTNPAKDRQGSGYHPTAWTPPPLRSRQPSIILAP